jgi:dTDP-4-dehydrorhamnose reductase
MKILILGGDGMLGHQLFLRLREGFETRVTLRQDFPAYRHLGCFSPEEVYTGIDVRVTDRLLAVLADFRPEYVVNAVGMVKQRPEGHEHIANLEVNALLPHRLGLACRAIDANLIHISTDCVFSGRRGNYTEADQPDPVDVYGYSKLLGEVSGPGVLTLRTSIIGLELMRHTSLIEWFLDQRGPIKGYRQAIFSGFTTRELSRIIERLVTQHAGVMGLYHLASEPISKYDLLVQLRDRLRRDIEITPDDALHCDRSLDSSRFRNTFDYRPPSWDGMLEELAADIRERQR